MHLLLQDDTHPGAIFLWTAETTLCQTAGELACWSQLHSSLVNSGFWKACAWSWFTEDLFAVDAEKQCHCCSALGQEKAGLLITSTGHFFLLQGIICFWIDFLSCPASRWLLFFLVSEVWPFLGFVWEMCYWSDNVLGVGWMSSTCYLGYWWFWGDFARSHHPSATLDACRISSLEGGGQQSRNVCYNSNSLFFYEVNYWRIMMKLLRMQPGVLLNHNPVFPYVCNTGWK